MTNNCLQCHTYAETGAPILGDTDQWQAIAAQGEETILKNVVEGIRGMPPLGYCSACSEEDFRVLIRFFANLPAPSDLTSKGEQ
jgi:cytochrome c5